MHVPFFRPSLTNVEIEEVVHCLKSGWLTTGQQTKSFESRFAAYVGAEHAVAVNSCTAALHLALEAVGLKRDEIVLVPTMTFAATAEVVRYFDAIPVFVDADPQTLCMDPAAAAEVLASIAAGRPVPGLTRRHAGLRAIIPVHYGGQMVDVDAFRRLATQYAVPLIEDAAHTVPASYRSNADSPWRPVGTTADITCFSFYANKCITTGEGGMAVTNRADWADRMRVMSLHGMSRDAWKRFMGGGSWRYEIIAPGFKYNLTDVAASLGLRQLERADELWRARSELAQRYSRAFAEIPELEVPVELPDRKHSWHLYALRLNLSTLGIGRDEFIEKMKERGVASSVHWMPLHLHPYYVQNFDYRPEQFPVAAREWERLISLPLFPDMTDAEHDRVVETVRSIVHAHRRTVA